MNSEKSDAPRPAAELEGRVDCDLRDASALRRKADSDRILPPVGKRENQCGSL
jgi:hypothetical protein